jgi:hypothetical protein
MENEQAGGVKYDETKVFSLITQYTVMPRTEEGALEGKTNHEIDEFDMSENPMSVQIKIPI